MTRYAIMLTAVTALTLSACASAPDSRPGMIADGSPQSWFGELPAQNLKQGQCALALWSRASPPVRFAMTLNEPAIARVQIDGALLELPRVEQTGEPVFGQYPVQRFQAAGASFDVRFSLSGMGRLNGGAVISSAVVEYADAKGWTAIVPAAGLIACQV